MVKDLSKCFDCSNPPSHYYGGGAVSEWTIEYSNYVYCEKHVAYYTKKAEPKSSLKCFKAISGATRSVPSWFDALPE